MGRKKTFPFWVRVKKHIRAHKISQEKFAAYVGINFYTFKSWIYYNRIPDVITAYRMAIALGVTIEYLVTGSDGKAMEIRKNQARERKTAAAEIKKMARQIEKNTRLIR